MANYGTVEEVRALLPPGQRINDQSGYPTGPTALTILTRTSNQVNVALSALGVSLPITDPDLLGDISQKVTREVAYQIMSMRGGIADKDTVTKIDLWHQEFLAFLEPPDATEAGAVQAAEPSSFTMLSPNGADTTIDPVFRRAQAHNW